MRLTMSSAATRLFPGFLLAAAISVAATACAVTAEGGRLATPPVEADLILRGSPVYTLDAVRSWAEAIAIRENTIVYVGPESGAQEYAGPGTRVLELDGGMVLPAFQDIHVHPISAGVSLRALSLYGLETQEQYMQAVAEYAEAHPDLEWIRGSGWLLDAFPSGIPDKRLLDEVVAERPVYLRDAGGHSLWVNSRALELAGITRDTPDPVGGRIDRDPQTGEPLGALQDSANSLVSSLAPPTTFEDMVDGLRYALELLNGYGITSLQDASVRGNSLSVYRTLDESGELTARVVASLRWDRSRGVEQIPELLAARRQYTRDRVRATTVKIGQDGVIEVQTGAVLEPYLGTNETGIPMVEPETLKRVVTRLDREGFQVHFHAVGDAAIRQCLDAVEAARAANGSRDARHHIAHLELFHPDDIPRLRQLGVVANFQPLWAAADHWVTAMGLPLFEPERARWLFPIGSLLKSGAVVAFGSDWSVSSANPLEQIEVAVTRMNPAGGAEEPFIPEERIGLHDALAAFTINAAYVNFQEKSTGSIEVGKLADLIVLDRNLFAIAASEISEVTVVLTLLGGAPVHGDLELFGS